MHQKLRSHRPSHSTIAAYLALFVALGGTTYAATGGNFILGQSNTAGAPTTLASGTTNGSGAFKVTNTSTGRAITAVGTSGGFGVYASGGHVSRNTAAIHGQSTSGNAVEGISGKDIASGVYGLNNSTGFGVAGRSTNGTGVLGDSSSGRGLDGRSDSWQGVYGHSNTNAGVVGESQNFDGVYGVSNSQSAAGVSGHNDVGGIGVFGGSPSGYAFSALGNASQDRSHSGFVKAMAIVDPLNHPSDPIQRCFNSQLPPSQATSDNCGITYSSSQTGQYALDFGFQVDDRFVSATPQDVVGIAALPRPGFSNQVEVFTFDTINRTAYLARFYLFVY